MNTSCDDPARASLAEIVNGFASRPVPRAFAAGELRAAAVNLHGPGAHLYRPIVHPCTAAVVLARLIEAAAEYGARTGKAPAGRALAAINAEVARSLNLIRPGVL